MRYYALLTTILAFFLCLNASFGQSEEYGVASFYDDSFQGSKTASGEAYDKDKYTGAHKKLPFGTIVQVTRLDNKKSVKIRINDRGPYIKGRIIELSRKAAEKVGLTAAGVAKVKVEVLGSGVVPDEFSTTSVESDPPEPEREVVVVEEPRKEPAPAKSKTNVNKPPREKPKSTAAAPRSEQTTPEPETPKAKPIEVAETARRVRGRDFKTYDLYKVQILRPERGGYGVQVASLTNYANVMKQVAELQEKWFKNILISVEEGTNNQPVYKILLGPFPDRATAKSYEKDLKRKKRIDGFIVDLSAIKY